MPSSNVKKGCTEWWEARKSSRCLRDRQWRQL